MTDSQSQGVIQTGAPMNYEEHEKTYRLFQGLLKYTLLVVSALLIAMAFGFFTTAGFISSAILFVLINAIGIWIMR